MGQRQPSLSTQINLVTLRCLMHGPVKHFSQDPMKELHFHWQQLHHHVKKRHLQLILPTNIKLSTLFLVRQIEVEKASADAVGKSLILKVMDS